MHPVTVVVGRVRWNGQALQCPDCGVPADRWSLSVDEPAGAAGGVAVATCVQGHGGEHPLLYPAIVYAAAEWTRRPADERPDGPHQQTGALRGWVPHWVDWTTDDEGRRAPVYRDWTEPGAELVDWSRWPEISAGQKLVEDVRDWSSQAMSPDLSVSWLLAWGTTDPDVRHIELVASAV